MSHRQPQLPLDDGQPRPPSHRDQVIYFQVRILQHTQADVGGQFGLSQVRISQIVRRVAQWHADTAPEAAGELSPASRKRLANREFRLRTEQNLAHAMVAFLNSQKPLVTRKKSSRTTIQDGAEVKVVLEEEVEREQRVDTRALALVGKFTQELLAHEDRPPPPTAATTAEIQAEAFKKQKDNGKERALAMLRLVRSGLLSLDFAERCNFESSKHDGLIYPSYYEKSPSGKSLRPVPWLDLYLPRPMLTNYDQPRYSVLDIPDFSNWHSNSPAVKVAEEAAARRMAAWEELQRGQTSPYEAIRPDAAKEEPASQPQAAGVAVPASSEPQLAEPDLAEPEPVEETASSADLVPAAPGTAVGEGARAASESPSAADSPAESPAAEGARVGQRDKSRPPFAQWLTSGRPLSPRKRRQIENMIAQRQAAAEARAEKRAGRAASASAARAAPADL